MTYVWPSPRRGDIQGLRAVAVVFVVAYHAGFGFPGGFVGVDAFFVISGYVITGVLLRELDAQGSVDLRNFYLRRVRRLLPALAVMLAVVMASASVLSPAGGQQMTSRTGAAAALVNANTYLMRLETGYFDADIEFNALLHTWSLSVEEQFYLGFPLLILGAWHFGRRASWLTSRQAVVLGLLAVSGTSLFLALYLVYFSGLGTSMAFYLAPARAWEFVVGALLAVRPDLVGAATRRVATPLAVLGALLVGWSSVAYDAATVFPGIAVSVPVVGTAFLLAAGEGSSLNPVSRTLACGPAQWLGDRSYGWYLWHWPALVFAAALFSDSSAVAATAVAVSLGLAVVSHRLVEEPIRHRPSVPARFTVRLGAVCIVVPLVAAFGLASVARWLDDAHMDEFAAHVDQELGCDGSVPLGDRGVDSCTWSVDEPAGVAVLIGDSQAGQLMEGFTAAMSDLNFTAIAASKSGCPFVDLRVVPSLGAIADTSCQEFVQRSTADLVELSPDVVVIASATDLYLRGAFTLSEPAGGAPDLTRVDEREAAWGEGLERTVSALTEVGIEVVIVHPIPKYPGWDPRGCAAGLWMISETRCARSGSAAEFRSALAPAVRVERSAADQPGAHAVELFSTLCSEDDCSTLTDDGWTMRDGAHISVAASRRLAPWFLQAIEDISITS